MKVLEDGTYSVRLEIPPLLFNGVKLFADRNGLSMPQAFRMFVSQVDARVAADPHILEASWAAIFEAARSNAIISAFTAAQLNINHEKLAKSPRLKSGFVGVYAGPAGFKAMGKDPVTKAQKYLGIFQDAAEAAWHRYLHYKQHGLPYGRLEDTMDRIRAEPSMAGKSEADIRREALEYERITKSLNLLEPEEAEEAVRNYEATLAELPPHPARKHGPPKLDDSFYGKISTHNGDSEED